MSQTISIVDSLKEQVLRLRRILERDIKVGDNYPGESQVATIQSLIELLESEIRQDPGPQR